MPNNKQITIEIGNLIRRYRNQNSRTISWLAEQVDIGDKHMGDIERGKFSTKLENYYKIKRALNIPNSFWDELQQSLDARNH